MTDMSDVPAVDPKNTDSYRMLRAVVIGLGVLIIIAVVLLVVGLATRLGGHGWNHPIPAFRNVRVARVCLATGRSECATADASADALGVADGGKRG